MVIDYLGGAVTPCAEDDLKAEYADSVPYQRFVAEGDGEVAEREFPVEEVEGEAVG